MTVRHEITVRTVPSTNGAEIVTTTVETDTATVEQVEVVDATNRSILRAHMGWTVTLRATGRRAKVTEHGDLTSATARNGRSIKVTDETARAMVQEIIGARLARPRPA